MNRIVNEIDIKKETFLRKSLIMKEKKVKDIQLIFIKFGFNSDFFFFFFFFYFFFFFFF